MSNVIEFRGRQLDPGKTFAESFANDVAKFHQRQADKRKARRKSNVVSLKAEKKARFKARYECKLSFVASRRKLKLPITYSGNLWWHVTPSDDPGGDWKKGRELALEYLNEAAHTPFQWIIQDMPRGDALGRIESGFLSEIGLYAALGHALINGRALNVPGDGPAPA